MNVCKDQDMILDIDFKVHNVEILYRFPVISLELGTSNLFSKVRSWGLVLEAVAGIAATLRRNGVISTSADWYHSACETIVSII